MTISFTTFFALRFDRSPNTKHTVHKQLNTIAPARPSVLPYPPHLWKWQRTEHDALLRQTSRPRKRQGELGLETIHYNPIVIVLT